MVHRDPQCSPVGTEHYLCKAVLLNLAVQLRLGSTCSSGSRAARIAGSVGARSWL
jgi:hypothetical protein